MDETKSSDVVWEGDVLPDLRVTLYEGRMGILVQGPPKPDHARVYELARALAESKRGTEALEADNAALRAELRTAVAAFEGLAKEATRDGIVQITADTAEGLAGSFRAAAEQPHPGAALLEELRALRAQVETRRGERDAARQEAELLTLQVREERDGNLAKYLEILSLRAQVATLEAEVTAAETDADAARREAEDARNEATVEREARAMLERQRDAAQAALSAAMDAVSMANAEMERATRERDHWKAQATTLEADMKTLQDAAATAASAMQYGRWRDALVDAVAQVGTAKHSPDTSCTRCGKRRCEHDFDTDALTWRCLMPSAPLFSPAGQANLTVDQVAARVSREPVALRVDGMSEPLRDIIARDARDAALEEAADAADAAREKARAARAEAVQRDHSPVAAEAMDNTAGQIADTIRSLKSSPARHFALDAIIGVVEEYAEEQRNAARTSRVPEWELRHMGRAEGARDALARVAALKAPGSREQAGVDALKAQMRRLERDLKVFDAVHPDVLKMLTEHPGHIFHWGVRCITCAPTQAEAKRYGLKGHAG